MITTGGSGGVHGHLGLSCNAGAPPGAAVIERHDRSAGHAAGLQHENGRVPAACAHRRRRIAGRFHPGVTSALLLRFPLAVF